MNRSNYGGGSGVIVDVCGPHGVFLDRGELTKIVDFLEKGGWERVKKREKQRMEEEISALESRKSGARSISSHGPVAGYRELIRDSSPPSGVPEPLGLESGASEWTPSKNLSEILFFPALTPRPRSGQPPRSAARGQVSEWFKEHGWKPCVAERLPWVRIPPCPP